MGHIINSLDGYDFLQRTVSDLYGKDVCKNHIDEIMGGIIPRDEHGKPLIKSVIKEKGRETGVFRPDSEAIYICIDKLNNWLDVNSKDLVEYFRCGDIELLKPYLVLMLLTHETEHSYQYLIGEGIVNAPCKILQQGYKSLFDLMKKQDDILPRPIKQTRRAISLISYYRRQNEYLLERNAQFDSLSLMWEIAFHNGHDEICSIFDRMKNTFALAGYTDNVDGTLINTFKNIYMGDKLKKFDYDYENIDMIERFRLGLPVDESTRGRILALKR